MSALLGQAALLVPGFGDVKSPFRLFPCQLCSRYLQPSAHFRSRSLRPACKVSRSLTHLARHLLSTVMTCHRIAFVLFKCFRRFKVGHVIKTDGGIMATFVPIISNDVKKSLACNLKYKENLLFPRACCQCIFQ